MKAPFVDLTGFVTGVYVQEIPTIGEIQGGKFLIYAGRINETHGEPGGGKSIVALVIALDQISKGRRVIFLDPEDQPKAIVGRLLSFGARPEDILEFFHYVHNPDPKDVLAAITVAQTSDVSLVIVDGLAEMLAALGLNENDPGDILRYFRGYVRPFTDTGAAAIVNDHVAKDAETRGRWARGSGAKLGRYDGVSYEVKTVNPFGPDQAGMLKLVVCKDRNGGVGPRDHVAAEVHISPAGDGFHTNIEIKEPNNHSFQPTYLMEKVSKAIEFDPDISLRDLRKLGKVEYINTAIETLANTGYLRIERGGAGKANKYILLQEYREPQQ